MTKVRGAAEVSTVCYAPSSGSPARCHLDGHEGKRDHPTVQNLNECLNFQDPTTTTR